MSWMELAPHDRKLMALSNFSITIPSHWPFKVWTMSNQIFENWNQFRWWCFKYVRMYSLPSQHISTPQLNATRVLIKWTTPLCPSVCVYVSWWISCDNPPPFPSLMALVCFTQLQHPRRASLSLPQSLCVCISRLS